MKIKEALDLAKELVDVSQDALAVQILEVLDKHGSDGKLTPGETLLAGIRFYEFFAPGSSDSDYAQAMVKQQSVYKKLGLPDDFYKKIDDLAGWSK